MLTNAQWSVHRWLHPRFLPLKLLVYCWSLAVKLPYSTQEGSLVKWFALAWAYLRIFLRSQDFLRRIFVQGGGGIRIQGEGDVTPIFHGFLSNFYMVFCLSALTIFGTNGKQIFISGYFTRHIIRIWNENEFQFYSTRRVSYMNHPTNPGRSSRRSSSIIHPADRSPGKFTYLNRYLIYFRMITNARNSENVNFSTKGDTTLQHPKPICGLSGAAFGVGGRHRFPPI